MMTIERQIEDMAACLPEWQMTRIAERTAFWVGELTPYNTTYRVRVEHTVPPVIEYQCLLRLQPLVEVLSPRLQRRNGSAEGALPHVYWEHPRAARPGPFLCVFDADAREWTLSDPLSTTTIPFTLNWLQSYEGWLATGKWLGLGRHAGQERTGEPNYKLEPGTGPDTPRSSLDRFAALAASTAALGS
ncbi:hypothetical protein [Jiella endophytica]|uniref:hypothetical protein n=1 Tax=Jiella endophytica TaxID=2558362 RepID=UPI0019800EFB|nr:hypothetical protein [Jiella endophytica]